MHTVTVRELQERADAILDQLSDDRDVVVTAEGKPVAILSKVLDNDLERSLTSLRRARAIAAVSAIQSVSREAGLDRIGPEEIDDEIRDAREGR